MRSATAALLLLALLTGACGGVRSDQAGVGASPTTSLSSTPSPEPKPTLAPTATPTRTLAFPDVPLLTGTMQGELRRYEGGEWKLEAKICSAGQEVRGIELAPAAAKVLVKCLAGGAGPESAKAFLYDLKARATREVSNRISQISPDARQAVVTTMVDCGGPSPGSCWRTGLVDLQTGAEREIIPAPGLVTIEMRWTALGLSYFLPVCGDSACGGTGGRGGTYLWDGAAWKKISGDRLIFADGNGTLVLERTGSISLSSRGPSAVVLRNAGGESVLTPKTIEREYAVALLDDGRVVAWRPEGTPSSGTIVIYQGGTIVRESRGRFERFQATRSGDWLIATELAGAPSYTLLAYSLSQDAFAAKPANLWLVGLAVVPTP